MRGFAAASLELHQPLNTIFDAESDKMSNHREVIIMARTTSEFARQSVQSPLIRKSELRHFLFVIPKGYRRGNDGRLLCYFKLPMQLSTSTLQMSRSATVEKREPCSVCHASVLGRPLHVDVPAPRQRDIQTSDNFHPQRELRAGKVGDMSTEEKEQPMGGVFKRPWSSCFPACFFTVAVEQPLNTPSTLSILIPATRTLTAYLGT